MERSNNNLVLTIKDFHEACRITSNYNDLKSILEKLEAHFAEHAASADLDYTLMKDDFSTLIPVDRTDRSVKHIIRWCMAHGYLQQAVTMTAEWFPRYALAAGVFRIKDAIVEEENDQQRQPWDTWTGNLFKNYNPYSASKDDPTCTDFEVENMSVKGFRKVLQNKEYDCWDVFTTVRGHFIKLDAFLTELLTVGPKVPTLQFAKFVLNLKDEHPIKVLCQTQYKPVDDEGLKKAINKGLKNAKNPAKFILYILSKTPANVMIELFGLPEIPKTRTARTDDETKKKISARQEVFHRLLNEGKIASSDKKLFLEVVEKQLEIVEFYRNRMNHGVIRFNGVEGNKAIADKVEELLSMAEKLEDKI